MDGAYEIYEKFPLYVTSYGKSDPSGYFASLVWINSPTSTEYNDARFTIKIPFTGQVINLFMPGSPIATEQRKERSISLTALSVHTQF